MAIKLPFLDECGLRCASRAITLPLPLDCSCGGSLMLELAAVSLRLGGECVWPAKAGWPAGLPLPIKPIR